MKIRAPEKPRQPEAGSPKFKALWDYYRYYFVYGGRGSMKSWEIAKKLIWTAHSSQQRWLCTREFQTSIKNSVHRLLKDTISRLGLIPYFDVTDSSIKGKEHGSEFLFGGLRLNAEEIKSMEGLDGVWVEEGEKTSAASMKILRPTIRKPGSSLIFSWNPEDEWTSEGGGPIVDKMTKTPPKNSVLINVSWRDNPHFTQELEDERQDCLLNYADDYEWIWEGAYRKISHAQIFRGRVFVEDFETPADAKLRQGADWGFAEDPSALVECFIQDVDGHAQGDLYISNEAFGYHVELDDTGTLFETIPGAKNRHILADCSRPETIAFMQRRQWDIVAAPKWPGSVEDGISFMKAFRRIVIHQTKCPNVAREFKRYRYKTSPTLVDSKGEPMILAEIVDKDNHGIDAIRYALSDFIKSMGDNVLEYYRKQAQKETKK